MALAPAAAADRAEPVPIYGYYNAFLDHSRQTFNASPATAEPSTQLGLFTTDCDVNGCVSKWLRETEISQDPDAPAQFEYRWNGDRWESAGEYPFYCNPDGSGPTVVTQRSDWLKPDGDGGFSGERMFTVPAPGCPGRGPGTYWLPIALTPVDPPQPR
ncbi:hypothetical protein BHQ17_17275 [Mycolicibacterium holsaticum]|uniref:PknF protein n=1 Tax=Mycolicibacterium holsaticum TaxID=152142 RepID=A0A1E3RL63_9MYCO|nr:hypothetical protein BHQ17_17275 [Mycolicibacterium holsaticum]